MLVAIVLLIDQKRNRVLLSQRPHDKPHGGLWELPGGKVETGETWWQALERELQEELGIKPIEGRLISELAYTYPDYTVELKTFAVQSWQGQVYGREGQLCHWVECDKLEQYSMPSGTRQVLTDIGWLN